MNTRILSLFVFGVLLVALDSCRKQEKVVITPAQPPTTTPTPPTMPDLPTEDMEGRYLWHGKVHAYLNGKDTIIDGIVLDGISVINDTTLTVNSDEDNSWSYGARPRPYKYVSSNDSEVVYSYFTTTITYKFKRNLVVWNNGTSVLYGVPGQTVKWAPLHEAKVTGTRSWHRTKKYYTKYDFSSDTTVTLPDTSGSAFLLFKSVSGDDKESLFIAGADSTGIVYQRQYYDAGPNSLHIIGSIRYFASYDSVGIYYDEYSPFGSTFTFNSY